MKLSNVLTVAVISLAACQLLDAPAGTSGGTGGVVGGGAGGTGEVALTAIGPAPVANHGDSVTFTLYGQGFGNGLRVFFRNRSSDTEIRASNIRVVTATHAHAEVVLGTKAMSWYVSVSSATGPRSSEMAFRVIGDDYPDSLKGKPCSYSASDQFGFVPRNCTSFVAWRLSEDGAAFPGSAGVTYTCSDGRTLTAWSHARCWDEAAKARGYVVNHTARVGSIAQWNNVGVSVNGAPIGHVAYVVAVFLDSQEVLIEEYNLDVACGYSVRRLRIDQVENFIHIRDA